MIKMMYKPTEDSKPLMVDVYDVSHTFNAEGKIIDTICTAWASEITQWIVSPLWCFIPVKTTCKKILKESK